MADGYMSYVVTPEMFADALGIIAAAAEEAGREIETFGTSHLLFCCIDGTYEKALDRAAELLSKRYAMDFRKPAQRYAALGTPADIAEKIAAFHKAGVRHFNLDFIGDQADAHRRAEPLRRRGPPAYRLSASAASRAARCPSAAASASEPARRTAPARKDTLPRQRGDRLEADEKRTRPRPPAAVRRQASPPRRRFHRRWEADFAVPVEAEFRVGRRPARRIPARAERRLPRTIIAIERA